MVGKEPAKAVDVAAAGLHGCPEGLGGGLFSAGVADIDEGTLGQLHSWFERVVPRLVGGRDAGAELGETLSRLTDGGDDPRALLQGVGRRVAKVVGPGEAQPLHALVDGGEVVLGLL